MNKMRLYIWCQIEFSGLGLQYLQPVAFTFADSHVEQFFQSGETRNKQWRNYRSEPGWKAQLKGVH